MICRAMNYLLEGFSPSRLTRRMLMPRLCCSRRPSGKRGRYGKMLYVPGEGASRGDEDLGLLLQSLVTLDLLNAPPAAIAMILETTVRGPQSRPDVESSLRSTS